MAARWKIQANRAARKERRRNLKRVLAENYERGLTDGRKWQRVEMTRQLFMPVGDEDRSYESKVVWLSPKPEQPHFELSLFDAHDWRMMFAPLRVQEEMVMQRVAFAAQIRNEALRVKDPRCYSGYRTIVVCWPEWRRVL